MVRRPSRPSQWLVSISLSAAFVALAAISHVASAQQTGAPSRAPMIIERIDEAVLTRLPGNVSPLARPEHDMGLVPGTLTMDQLAFVLKRSPAQQQALAQLLSAQQDPKSPQYHRWLTPEQFGRQFGAAEADIQTLSSWLQGKGFAIRSASRGRNLLLFSGTEKQVEAAFHTQIHYFDVDGERHFANVSDPQLPSALAPAIAGLSGLHDFRPKPQHHVVPAAGRTSNGSTPLFNAGANGYGVGPTDFATIYNIQPLWKQGITGTGVTIAIAAQSNVSVSTPQQFWSAFGVAKNQTINVMVPSGPPDPLPTGGDNEVEADLDVEVAGSVAQNATLILVPSSNVINSIAYAIDNNVAPILSISFGGCELRQTTAGNAQIATLYQQASTQGITVLVASGDQGSAGCELGGSSAPAPATGGLAVNALASTPYDTAVGGTDFNFIGVTGSQYWGAANAPGTLSDALSYMPEMAWNSSCANPILLQLLTSYLNVEAICNDPQYAAGVVVEGGGGGLSNCTAPTGSTPATCAGGYAQPSWQNGVVGIPTTTTLRAVPDISFFASNGFDGVAWVMCSYQNTTCDANGTVGATDGYTLLGGTSASTPAFAGIMALLLQTQSSPASPDGRQGLINPRLYQLASVEYGTAQAPNTAMLASCNSNNGHAVGSSCIFYDVTAGGNAQPCATGSTDCFTQTTGDAYGVTAWNPTTAYYGAGAGFDLATGLGSLNVANFVAAWTPPNISISSEGTQTVTVSTPITPVAFTLTGAAPLTVTPMTNNLASLKLSPGCGTTTMSCTASATAPASPGASTMTLTVLDPYGQSATTSASVTVTDPPPPTISISSEGTQSVVVNTPILPIAFTLTGTGSLTVTAMTSDMTMLTLSSGCGSTSLSCTATGTAANSPGTGTLTFTVTDGYDQYATAAAAVTVAKPAPPTISIVSGGTQSAVVNAALAPVAFTLTGTPPLTVTQKASDLSMIALPAGCGTTTMSCTANVGKATAAGTASLTLSVQDSYAQAASATATVTVTSPPSSGGGGALGLSSLLGLGALAAMRSRRPRR